MEPRTQPYEERVAAAADLLVKKVSQLESWRIQVETASHGSFELVLSLLMLLTKKKISEGQPVLTEQEVANLLHEVTKFAEENERLDETYFQSAMLRTFPRLRH